MGKIVVGRWDCSYCGTKGIRGSERECPNCGRPRGEDVKFYVDDPKDYVPEDEATKISKEPEWMCEFCGSYNSAKLTKCMSCGAERGKSKDYFQVQEATEKKNLEKQKLQKMILNRTTKKKKSISTSKASKKIIHSMILVLTI